MDDINYVDIGYLSMLEDIRDNGVKINSRNAQTTRLTNKMITFKKTPLVTLRRTAWKNALREFEWFMSGSNNINDLHSSVKSWWEPWALKDDTLWNYKDTIPNNYSKQFRDSYGKPDHGWDRQRIDQIQYMIDTLKKDPNSRRNVITTWNTADMVNPETPITNCHGSLIQAFVNPNDTVDLTMYQRSCDMMLGVPHNFIQYWAFLHYLAHQSGRKVGRFTWIGGDCHVYPDHIDTIKDMRKAYDENRHQYSIPNLVYKPTSDEFRADDFKLDSEYKPLVKKTLKMTV